VHWCRIYESGGGVADMVSGRRGMLSRHSGPFVGAVRGKWN